MSDSICLFIPNDLQHFILSTVISIIISNNSYESATEDGNMESINMHSLNTIYTISVISPSANMTNTVHTEFCSTIFSGIHHIVLAKILLFNNKNKRET